MVARACYSRANFFGAWRAGDGPPGDDAGCFAAVLLADPQRLFAGGAQQHAGHRRAEQADHGHQPDFPGRVAWTTAMLWG